MKKKYIIISVICIICAAACALIAMFGTGLFGKGEPEAPPMAQPAQEEPEPEPAQSASSVPEETPYTSPIDFEALKAENPDIYGWLEVPNTDISYPLLQSATDDTFYLDHDRVGISNVIGSLFTVHECNGTDFTDRVTPIYGHHMKSGAMFGNLTDYENKDFYENHKNIILYTEECQRNYEVIAVFRSQVYRKTDQVFKFYKFFQADTQEEFDDFYNNIKQLSQYDTGVTAEFGDHFLTLSTCVYHVEQGRFVVVAKEVEPGDHYLPIQE